MNDLAPTRILITSGATQEPIDEVRYLGNRSSGQLGNVIALTGATHGYEVTLLHGLHAVTPTSHPRMNSIPYSSSRDLAAKLEEHWPSHTILIMAAAVADFTPRGGQLQGKIQRSDELTITFTSIDDLVLSLAQQSRDDQRILAFALGESKTLDRVAQEKLERKQVDAIVANPLETMESSTIQAKVFMKNGKILAPSGSCSKPEFAQWLIENLEDILSVTSSTQ